MVPFVQFEKGKNTHGGVIVLVKLHQAANLLKVSLLMGVFTLFLNYKNDIKSRKAFHMVLQGKSSVDQLLLETRLLLNLRDISLVCEFYHIVF